MHSIIAKILSFCFVWVITFRLAVAIVPFSAPASDFSTPYRKLLEFSRQFPQQKAYLHTDKSHYLAGEKIWVKAYLVSARSHVPDTTSTNLFVELVNTRNEVVDFMILYLKNGFAAGSIQLGDSIEGGNYQLKAYTNWMKNFSNDFIFSKDLFVHNPDQENYITNTEIRRNVKFNATLSEKQESMQFAFFPEGGNLVAGLENRVAFKAADGLGKGLPATGTLIDADNNPILEFQTMHDGMGQFSFTPNAGERYSARVVFEDGSQITQALPPAMEQGYLLRVDPGPEVIRVRVEANFDPAELNIPSEIFLMAHTRGQVGFIEKGNLTGRVFQTNISAGQFPEGVTHITLFGPNEKPLAERLVFISFPPVDDESHFVYWERNVLENVVEVDFWFNPPSSLSPSGTSFSLAVTENFSDTRFDQMNIATYLLLTSDIGASVNNPLYYFIDQSPERTRALDLLMLTHGWRRFNWNDLIAGKMPDIRFREASGLTIAGRVTPVSSARETGELNLEMSVGHTEDRDILSTRTDREGNFAFTDLVYRDLFTALITVERERRGRIYQVELFERTRESTLFSPNFNNKPHLAVQRSPDWKPRERPNFLRRLLNRPGTGQNTQTTSLFGMPDQTIYMEDLRVSYSNVFDLIRDKVIGLSMVNGEIVLRGPSSIRLSNEPLYYVDEIMVNRFQFLNIPVSDVERIEVLRGANTAILGSRGANGALLIYTRRAMHQQQYTYEYQLRGYHEPVEFFVSRINVEKNIQNQIPKTILWVPFITPDENGRLRVRVPFKTDPDKLKFRLEGVDSYGQVSFVYF